jgi:dihydrolipoamide dehydrogenase
MADKYDVAIIGSGPGGYIAAVRAGQLGLKAAVIEREETLGGVCLNWGCVPTKALISNAQMVRFLSTKADEFGIGVKDPSFSWQRAVARSRQVVNRMTRGVAGLMKKNHVDVVMGVARFEDPHTLQIEGGAVDRVEAEKVIVATGSRDRLLGGLQADGATVLTSRDALVMGEVPQRMLIMGAGPIGMEMAYILSAYGARVTVVEMMDQVLPLEDVEASALVQRRFETSGIEVRLGTKVESVVSTEGGVRLTLSRGGKEEMLEGDKVLVAIGRAPNSEGLGLEEIGVATERGFVKTDRELRTSVEHIYAIGDVAGPPMLAHKASHEGVLAVEHMAGKPVHPVDPTLIPSCTYCQPQVASVGLTEAKALAAGYEIKVGRFPFIASGKALAMAEHDGWVKIVSDARYGEILGATIVGPEATELIQELALARSAELTADDLAATIYAHPTLSEAIHEAALDIVAAPLNI